MTDLAPPDPRSYTPRHLAEKILSSRGAIEGERKQVTVLFADLKGSMDLSETIDPEDWHRIMERFFQILTDGVHRFEGTVNQYTGDGIMALFGAPIAHEDHAARACYAALALDEGLRRYANELRLEKGINFSVRMGLNSGEVVVGRIGDDLRMDYTALGHTASLGARMEQIAEPGKCYLSERTAKLVEGLVALKSLGRLEIKGVREPLGVYELEGTGPLRTRFDVMRSRGLTRFVGRDDDVRTLEGALARAREGNGQVVGLVGEAGVGKSRLCFEFVERCRREGLTVLEGRAVSHGKNIPFLAMLEVFRSYYGITEQDSAGAAREKIAGRLLLIDESFREALPVLFDFFGASDPERPSPRLDPEARQRQLFGVLRRLVRRDDQRDPIVALIEDLHWLDGGSEAFLVQWVEALAGTRNLLLLSFRPEYRAGWMQKSYYHRLPLLPLGPDAIREFLHDLLGKDRSVSGLATMIYERTAGNPFFTEEVVQSLVEAGHLQGAKGSYRLATPIESFSVPPTVQAVLAARIDRLPEREKRVLEAAAVVGKTFSESILANVTALARADLAAALSTLRQAEFVYEEALFPEAEYSFKHPLTQEVAYGSQLSKRRAETHAAVARLLPDLHPQKLDERAALLAHHWEAAGEPLEAARWHRRAAQWAGGSDPAEAVRHWRKVRAIVGALPPSPEAAALGVAALANLLQFVWRMGGSEGEVAALFSEGRALAERTGDQRLLVVFLLNYTAIRILSGAWAMDQSVEDLRHGARLADGTDDAGLKLAAYGQLAHNLLYVGRLQEGMQHAEKALRELPADPRLGADVFGFSPYIVLLAFKARLAMPMGRLAEAARLLDRVLELVAENPREVDARCAGHVCWAECAFLLGDADLAVRHGLAAVDLAERLGGAYWRAWSYAALGQAQVASSEWDEAVEHLERSLRIAREARTGREREVSTLVELAEAHLGRRDFDLAERTVAEAIGLAVDHGSRSYQAVAHLTQARVLLARGGAAAKDAIEAALARSMALVEETSAKAYEPFIHLERAGLAKLRGDEAAWGRELRQAHRLFLEIGAPLRAESVAQELVS